VGAIGRSSEIVLLASGGVDSTTLAYDLRAAGANLTLVSCDYGQRHRRELAAVAEIASALRLPHRVVDLSPVGVLLSGSALTDSTVAVPDGHYTDESMRITVVPHRNALLLDVAVALALAQGATAVAFAAHAGDHTIYPDCRLAFVEAFRACARIANEGHLPDGFDVLAPYIALTKTEIVRRGADLGVPFGLTWSCYQGGEVHCGRCGTCTERREAFQLAGVPDTTTYLRQP
jgi:7-cyano-7-deazaguanine synthase